jgi:hypothetical protein
MNGLAWLVVSWQLLTAQAGATPIVTRQIASERARDAAVERFVRQYLADLDPADTVHRYEFNRVDLNDDGTPEVLLRIDGPRTCGTGGCSLFVLRKTSGGYEEVSRSTSTSAPVVVSENRTRGWNDLVLWQRADPPREASHYKVLEFDGAGYPQNPSMEPARLLEVPVRGVAYFFARPGARAGEAAR